MKLKKNKEVSDKKETIVKEKKHFFKRKESKPREEMVDDWDSNEEKEIKYYCEKCHGLLKKDQDYCVRCGTHVRFETKMHRFFEKYVPKFLLFILILMPICELLYFLSAGGHLSFLGTSFNFRLDHFYKVFLIPLIFVYIFEKIYKRETPNFLEIAVYCYIWFTTLSLMTAHDVNVGWNGYTARYEGYPVLIFYAFYFLNAMSVKNQKIIKNSIKFICGLSIIHLICCALQYNNGWFIDHVLGYKYNQYQMVGLVENSNFLGSISSLMTAMAMVLYYYRHKIWGYLLFVISYIVLLLSNCTGSFLSFGLLCIIFLIFVIVRKEFNWKYFAVALLTCVVLFPINGIFCSSSMMSDVKSSSQVIENKIEDENASLDALGTNRIIIWKRAWKLIKERPLLGYGPDNMALVVESIDGRISSKAHNIYLNFCVSSGIFTLLSYCLWIFLTLWSTRKCNNLTRIVLCFGVLMYSIQGFFNINVIEITPMFFLLAGYLASYKGKNLDV